MSSEFRRLGSGIYMSRDKRILIRREVSQQTGRSDEWVWEITFDGKVQSMCWDTLGEAKAEALKLRSRSPSSGSGG